MATTKSNLEAAKISDVAGNITVYCTFNPFEYKVSKSNTYDEKEKNQANSPQAEFFKSGPQTLTLDLFFDTYETNDDVSLTTNKLWKLMETNTQKSGDDKKKISPPEVVFKWGVFEFQAYITSMTQTFTLFTKEGVPVRAKVNITFTQYTDRNDYPKQNPTSGASDIQRVWRVVAGDRLDAIAYAVYGESSRWRVIADRNQIRDPLALQPGQTLLIPTLGE